MGIIQIGSVIMNKGAKGDPGGGGVDLAANYPWTGNHSFGQDVDFLTNSLLNITNINLEWGDITTNPFTGTTLTGINGVTLLGNAGGASLDIRAGVVTTNMSIATIAASVDPLILANKGYVDSVVGGGGSIEGITSTGTVGNDDNIVVIGDPSYGNTLTVDNSDDGSFIRATTFEVTGELNADGGLVVNSGLDVTGDSSFNDSKVTNVAQGVNPTDGVNLSQVQTLIAAGVGSNPNAVIYDANSPYKPIPWVGLQAEYDTQFGQGTPPPTGYDVTILDATPVALTASDITDFDSTVRSIANTNKNLGVFSGEFDFSENTNGFYNDYLSGGVVNLTSSSSKTLGSTCSVQILGGLVGTLEPEMTRKFTGDDISVSPAKINEITVMYVSDTDIRMINRVFDVVDSESPSIPIGLTEDSKTDTTANISWTASTDNVGVTGYRVFRDALEVGTTATNSYADSGLTASTAYSYTVTAYDAQANESAQSSALVVTTTSGVNPDYYTFDGTTLDAGQWTLLNPDNTRVEVAQNNNLYMECLDSDAPTTTSFANGIRQVRQFSSGTFEFNLDMGEIGSAGGVVLRSLDDDTYAGFLKDSSNNYIRIHSSASGSTYTSEVLNNQRMRIVWNGSTAVCSYYDGSAWQEIGTLTASLTNVRLIIFGGVGGGSVIGDKVEFDDLEITSYVEI